MNDFGLYVVMTDPVVGYARCAEAAVRSGVEMVQLRMKHARRDDIIAVARDVRRITDGSETVFIVNDDPEIACEVCADGVHVGQDDMPPTEIRRRYPSLRYVGLSTHSLSQVVAANQEPVDYIGVGPVFATPTKDIPDPVLGLETMSEMIRHSLYPAVAIGGINKDNIEDVCRFGAKNYAVVRAVCKSAQPGEAIRAFARYSRRA